MPYFSKLSQYDFNSEVSNAKNVNDYFDEKVAELDFQEFRKEKRDFLLRCILSEFDTHSYYSDLNNNNINWNPNGDQKLNEIAKGFKDRKQPFFIVNTWFKLFDAYLSDPKSGNAAIVDNILDNLTPEQIWKNSDMLKTALVGPWIAETNVEPDAIKEQQQEIDIAREDLGKLLNLDLNNLPVYENINEVDAEIDADPAPLIPEPPIVIDDPNGNFKITRVLLPEENAKEQLLDVLSSKEASEEVKRNWLISYALRGLPNKDFEAKAIAIRDTKGTKDLLKRIIDNGPMPGFIALIDDKMLQWLKDYLSHNEKALSGGQNVTRRLNKFDKKLKEDKAAAEKARQEEEKAKALVADTKAALENAEKVSMESLVDALHKNKTDYALSPHSNENILKNSVTEEYIKNICADPDRADAFYKAAAGKKVDLYTDLGKKINAEKDKIQKGEQGRAVYKDFKENADITDAIASGMVLNQPVAAAKLAGFELFEKSIPDKAKLNDETKTRIDDLKELDSKTDYKGLYNTGSAIKKSAKTAEERFGFKKKKNNAYLEITERSREVIGARKGESAVGLYERSLARFNTKRWSALRQESRTHAMARKAAETMIDLRKEYGVKGAMGSLMSKITDPSERREFASKWLEAAQDLQMSAEHYVDVKNPFTFAGADRYGAAKDLRNIARRDVSTTLEAIKSYGGNEFSLADVYRDIAANKLKKAEKALNEFDFSKPTAKKDGRSVSDQIIDQKKVLIDTIYDVLAANLSSNALEKNPESAADNNFYKMRTQLEYSVHLMVAMDNYLAENMNKATILADLKNNGKKLMDKLTKDHNLNVEQIAKPEVKANAMVK